MTEKKKWIEIFILSFGFCFNPFLRLGPEQYMQFPDSHILICLKSYTTNRTHRTGSRKWTNDRVRFYCRGNPESLCYHTWKHTMEKSYCRKVTNSGKWRNGQRILLLFRGPEKTISWLCIQAKDLSKEVGLGDIFGFVDSLATSPLEDVYKLQG